MTAHPGSKRLVLPSWRVDGPDRVRPLSRWVGVVVLPFLAIAVVLLYGLASKTDTLFAWTIAPPFTAMVLGSAYVGGVWYFVQVIAQDCWHRVKYGFPAVVVFATLLGVATILHWDRFHAGHIAFLTWATLYLVTPVLTLVAVLLNWRDDDGRPERREVTLPLPVRLVLAAIGVAALLTGLTVFAFPALVAPVWGWDLTPLTSRVVGGVLTLPGVVNVWLLVDARWSAFRWMLQAELASLVFLLGAVLIAGGALRWERPMASAFVASLVVALGVYLGVYVWAERRLRSTHRARAD
jgi:hypothetical protein